jgi:hypothetical protein
VGEQSDFFEPSQLGFDLGQTLSDDRFVSSHEIRLELTALLEMAKAARERAPWDLKTHRHHQTIFPQLAKSLPPDEAEFLRRQFVLELDRIEKLLAA